MKNALPDIIVLIGFAALCGGLFLVDVRAALMGGGALAILAGLRMAR